MEDFDTAIHKAGLGVIPHVGGAVAELFQADLQLPLEKRRGQRRRQETNDRRADSLMRLWHRQAIEALRRADARIRHKTRQTFLSRADECQFSQLHRRTDL